MDEDNGYLNDLLGVLRNAEEKEKKKGLAEAAKQIRAMFTAMTEQGFSEPQALQLTMKLLEIGSTRRREEE